MQEVLNLPIDNIDMSVVKLNVTDSEVAKLENEFSELTVNGVEDREGLKRVYEGRQIVKRVRVSLVKYADELKETALAWQRKVNSEKNRIVARLEAVEEKLQAQEDKIAVAKEEIRKEIERKEQEALQVRVSELSALGYNVDLVLLKSLTAEQYTVTLSAAKSEWARREAEKAEAEKQRLAAEEKARQDAEELRVLRENQARADKIIRDQQEAIDREKAELVRKEQARLDQIKKDEQEKREIEIKSRSNQLVGLGMHFHLQSGSFRFESVEVSQNYIENVTPGGWNETLADVEIKIADLKRAAESIRLAEIEKQKADAVAKALADQAESDRLKKNAEAEKLALASDKQKFQDIIRQLDSITIPEMKAIKARKMAGEVKDLIGKIKSHIETILK